MKLDCFEWSREKKKNSVITSSGRPRGNTNLFLVVHLSGGVHKLLSPSFHSSSPDVDAVLYEGGENGVNQDENDGNDRVEKESGIHCPERPIEGSVNQELAAALI